MTPTIKFSGEYIGRTPQEVRSQAENAIEFLGLTHVARSQVSISPGYVNQDLDQFQDPFSTLPEDEVWEPGFIGRVYAEGW